MELKYTPRTIKEIEDVAKMPMVEAISNLSMGTVVLFVRKGLDVDEDKAYKAIEKYLAVEENEMLSLYLHILETLQKGGYIPKSMNIQSIRQQMQGEMSV